VTAESRRRHPFKDTRPEGYKLPDLNPYLKLHREMVPPVVTAEEAPSLRGRWAEAYARPAPLHLEIGPGNGFYLSGMASRHPECNWLGIEIRFKRVVLCARKIIAADVRKNARIARYDAWQLRDLFAPGELAGLHINFPDPWKKDRHEKHRLLGPELAAWAADALASGAELRVKSDHRPNLERMAAAAAAHPFTELDWSEDVGRDGAPWPDDLQTNYQSKFDKRDEPTYALLLRRD
jgi:tRNA (guanine-N7-)-methyltransferase